MLLVMLGLVLISASDCSKMKETTYKGRLEIKGICMNYTISILDQLPDTSLFVPSWTDEHTGKSYTNVFKLGSPCNFPENIQVGDEFQFVVDTTKPEKNCMVCMAFYPTPPKSLAIKVVNKKQ